MTGTRRRRRKAPDAAGPNLTGQWVITESAEGGVACEWVSDARTSAYPGYDEGRLRFLDADDVAAILAAVPTTDLQPEAAEELRSELNRIIATSIQYRGWQARDLPHDNLLSLSKMSSLVTQLEATAVDCGSILVREADISAPGEPAHPLARPRDLAFKAVANWMLGVAEIGRLARSGEARERKRVGQQKDYHRYIMIHGFAYVYEKVFNSPPAATCGGPWCLFLAAVLHGCEGKELSERGTYDLWLKVRRWHTSCWKDAAVCPAGSMPEGSGPVTFASAGRSSRRK